MRKMVKTLVFAAGMLCSGLPVLHAKTPNMVDEYLAMSAIYEKLAAEQTLIVKEHESMKAGYRANKKSLPRKTREKSLQEIEIHCDAVIADAEKLATDYKAIAEWNRLRAKELEMEEQHPDRN
jgi:hypothetical protein